MSAVTSFPQVIPVSANIANTRPAKQNQRSGQSWHPQNNNQQFQRYNNNSRVGKGYQGKCLLCGLQGHSAKYCPQLQQHQPLLQSNSMTAAYRPWQPRANFALASQHPANDWLLDSGATHHLTSDLNNVALHQPYSGDDSVLIGDGSGLQITHTGSLSLPSSSRNLTLQNVLCVPHIAKNLISVYRLYNANKVSVEFFPTYFQVKDLNSGVPLLQGKTNNELYEWPVTPSTITSFFASTPPKISSTVWHNRLGHPSFSILKTIISNSSLPCSQSVCENHLCTDCSINKSHKLPFSHNTIVSTRPLQYIYSDVWSSPTVSINNFKYYLILVDHYSRYTWLYPLKAKSQVREVFQAFKAIVENQFQSKIGTLYSDNGG